MLNKSGPVQLPWTTPDATGANVLVFIIVIIAILFVIIRFVTLLLVVVNFVYAYTSTCAFWCIGD
jgi:hypothetical protein